MGWYAAGYLNNSSGALNNRGSNGNYWSSTQNSTTNGYNLNFNSSNSNMNNNNKAYGFSVRCLSDYETNLPKPPACLNAGRRFLNKEANYGIV
ncbi:MAG: fibrobacter succinogenes major paralogous domain-containing protein [Candidatus Omnitrophica bacterium]|nr:fibrobacter succinogenes major paralogous domain-containing protein [Candidatus Omnitrophota bacterium]MBU1894702.1 fibrobacter succinogenes major paralogous domain-containing protein [Candidatus Omnitrophota bacterium]